MRVFLSYAREDASVAAAIADALATHGHYVWWDRNIASGEEFSDLIERELGRAEAVVVLWSPHSVKSRWVRDEAGIGGDTGRLVPVAIGGAQPPMGFRQFHTLDLTGFVPGKADARVDDLAAAIGRRGENDEPTVSQPGRSPAPVAAMAWWRNRRLIAIASVLAVLLAAAALYWRTTATPARNSKLSVALLPFEASGNDPQVAAIADQSRDFLADALASSGIDVRVVDKAPPVGRGKIQLSIAGKFSRVADKLQATVRIDDDTTGATATSERFEIPAAQADLFAERVGAQVAGSFGWAASLIMLEARHPSTPSVTAELLPQLSFNGDPTQKYQIALRAVRANPNSPMASIAHGFNFGTVMLSLPESERVAALAAARQSAERALKIAPEFGDAYVLDCFLHSETRFAECEHQMVAGQKADPDAPFVNAFLSGTYTELGRFDEASGLSRLSYGRDPYTPTKIAWMLRALERDKETKSAEDLYRKGVRWWPDFEGLMIRNRFSGRLERGDFDSIAKLVSSPHGEQFPPGLDHAPEVVKAVAARSADGVRRACTTDDWWPNQLCMVAFAEVGDLDSAYAIANRLFPDRVGRSPADADRIWMTQDTAGPISLLSAPSTAAMRRDPRFLEIARRTGVLQYWRTTHLPDFCTKAHEAVCAKIGKA